MNMNATILITGAGRGIGAACALLAAERGYRVCVNYRSDAAAAQSVVDAIQAAGGSALAVQADVADAGELSHALESIKWGTDYFIKAHTQPDELWAEVTN